MSRPSTIFLDLDGVVFHYDGNLSEQMKNPNPKVLPGVLKKIGDWDVAGHAIVITTGRRESLRVDTEMQLRNAGVYYDQLVMGIRSGKRFVINDTKRDSDEDTAFGITVKRNTGLENIEI